MASYPMSRLSADPEAYWAQWTPATNGVVKGYFLHRCIDGNGCTGQEYCKASGEIITFESYEAAQRKAGYFNNRRLQL